MLVDVRCEASSRKRECVHVVNVVLAGVAVGVEIGRSISEENDDGVWQQGKVRDAAVL